MLSVGVGGYMQQWFGMSSVDAKDKDGNSVDVRDGTAQQSDSEIYFKGKLESDSGLTFSVKVELEGNNQPKDGYSTGVIDESQLTIGGEFGQVVLGAEDPASTLTHHGSLDVGITLNCGDTHKWIDADVLGGCSHNGFGTYGHGHGDKNSISYYTPRVSGVQFGATYIPDVKQETGALAANANNDTDAWSVGGNYVGEFGGANVAFSLGHYQGSQVGESKTAFDGMMAGTGDDAGTRVVGVIDSKVAKGHETTVANYRKAIADALDGKALPTNGQADMAADAQKAVKPYQMSKMLKADDKTFSNAALQVGFGAFSFGVVYASNDGGAYKVANADRLMTATDFANSALDTETATYDATKRIVTDTSVEDAISNTTGMVVDKEADGSAPEGATLVAEGTNYDPDGSDGSINTQVPYNSTANDDPMVRMDKVVKDMSKNWDTWGAGVKYSEGPMAVSLSHLATEWDNGDEQDATMLSLSYTLAPGVASKTSVFTAERANADGSNTDGTAFVTGFALSF